MKCWRIGDQGRAPQRGAVRPGDVAARREEGHRPADRRVPRVAGDAALADWQLVIAGDGEAGAVSQRSRRLLPTGRPRRAIEFVGWVAASARSRCFAGAELFALPSHQENFGIAVVEAMACGMPVAGQPGVNLAADIDGTAPGGSATRRAPAFAQALRERGEHGAAGGNVASTRERWPQRFAGPRSPTSLRLVYERRDAPRRNGALAAAGELPIATRTERTH